MMPNSSQVHDHQLIFQIISGVGQFHHKPKRGEDESLPKKTAAGCQKKLAVGSKLRGVEVEVVVKERREGQTKTLSIYSSSRSSINSSTTVVAGKYGTNKFAFETITKKQRSRKSIF